MEKEKRDVILINEKIIFQDMIICLKIGNSPIGNSLVKIVTTAGEIIEKTNPMSFTQAVERLKEISSKIEKVFLAISPSCFLIINKITFFQITEERGNYLLSIGLTNKEKIPVIHGSFKEVKERMKKLITESGVENFFDFGNVVIAAKQISAFSIKEEIVEEIILSGGALFVIPEDRIKEINSLLNSKILSNGNK